MEASIGVNLRVTAHSNQGGRKYMEDMFCVAYQPTADDRDLMYAYFGIFDGHGGREAALYAKHHLMDKIVAQKNFWSEDDSLVLKAIRNGFINTHLDMLKELEKWPKTPSGLPSTSGTTASIAFVRRGKLYIGHVGDSGIVLGYEDPETGFWRAKPLTQDHKPDSPEESSRITDAGGKVIVKTGVPRVVWNRPKIGHKGPVRRSTVIDEIPFLAVARSLGDLWSYNPKKDEFVVSPEPDVSVFEIDVHSHRCLILGTDGLWNMLSPQDAVNSVYFAEKNNERQPQGATDPLLSKSWINPSKRLVDRALDRWFQHSLRADNTSVVTVVVDPPGPPKVMKRCHFRHSFASSQDNNGLMTAPVGISRYCPQRQQHTALPMSQKVAARLTSFPHPVITKTQGLSTTPQQQPVSTVSSRAKSTRKRTSLPPADLIHNNSSASVANNSSIGNSAQPSTSAFYPVTTRQYRDSQRNNNSSGSNNNNLVSPIHESSSRQSSTTDDVQIHEISSSSTEIAKTKKDKTNATRKRKGRQIETEIALQKKPRLPEGEGRIKPVTRTTTVVTVTKKNIEKSAKKTPTAEKDSCAVKPISSSSLKITVKVKETKVIADIALSPSRTLRKSKQKSVAIIGRRASPAPSSPQKSILASPKKRISRQRSLVSPQRSIVANHQRKLTTSRRIRLQRNLVSPERSVITISRKKTSKLARDKESSVSSKEKPLKKKIPVADDARSLRSSASSAKATNRVLRSKGK